MWPNGAGRAVVFSTGEPSGLTKTLPPALAQLRAVTGPHAKILLGFDRGGAYPGVFTACRDAGADWVTYRRAPLASPTRLPVVTTSTSRGGGQAVVVCADESVTIDGYDTARQITLFEHARVALQVLTSDTSTCPVALLTTLRARWRIENAFKYAAEHHGIDALADYIADLETNTRPIDNPARTSANATVKARKNDLADAERALAHVMCDRSTDLAALNRNLTGAHATIEKATKALAAAETTRDAVPAKLPANQIDPDARRALHHPPHPADGPAAAGLQRRTLAGHPPERLPTRQRRIPRDHPSDHPARHRRHHHLHPRGDHRRTPTPRQPQNHPRPDPAPRRDQHHPTPPTRRPPTHHLHHPHTLIHFIANADPISGGLRPVLRYEFSRCQKQSGEWSRYHICLSSRGLREWLLYHQRCQTSDTVGSEEFRGGRRGLALQGAEFRAGQSRIPLVC